MIRLREPEDSSSFLPWESILGTMLHELCHIAIGAHSAEFYKLLDELWTEIESSNSLWSGSNKTANAGSSYSFDGAYRKLGSSSSVSGAPVKNVKHLAAEAALKRQAFNAVSSSSGGSGGHRLGGAPLPPSSSHSDWQSLAGAAAERRCLDDVACDSDSTLPSSKNSSVGGGEGWVCEICLEENNAPKSASCYFCGGLTQAEQKEYSLLTSNGSSEHRSIPVPSNHKNQGILMKRQKPAEHCMPCSNQRSSDSDSGKRWKGSNADIVDLTLSAEPTPLPLLRERIELACSACTFINSVYADDTFSSCEICEAAIPVIDQKT